MTASSATDEVPAEAYVERWMKHIHALAHDIGPRGSTTPAEQQAAEYCASAMASLDFPATLEPFTSATSGYQSHLYVALGMLLAVIIYPLAGRVSAVLAALIAATALYSEVRELLFANNPVRRLMSKRPSYNAVSVVPPEGEHKQDLILIGHIDSNRTPLIFRSTMTVDIWRILTPPMFLGLVWVTGLYLVGALTGWDWVWTASLPGAATSLLLAAITLEGELTPYSHGANDNATGAGLVLALGEHLRDEPLQHTRVWLVNTGCEEVKHYGAIAFFARHLDELHNPKALVFEMLGRDGPAYLEREMLVPGFGYKPDPDLVAMMQRVAGRDPSLTVHPTRVTGGHTEQADALRVGVPAITLIGIGPEGTPIGYRGPKLYWHHKEDTVDKISPDVLERTYRLAWSFIRALDESA